MVRIHQELGESFPVLLKITILIFDRWALGVERIAQLIDEKQIPTDPRPIHIIPVLDPSDTQGNDDRPSQLFF